MRRSVGIPFEQITIGSKLGEGGFSEIYKGRWLSQNVALKKLKSGASMTHMEFFRDEAETLT